MRAFRTTLFLLGGLFCLPGMIWAETPQRVVSINLCTDQLALMIASPAQILSVSHLAADPRWSATATTAQSYRPNRGLAEDIFLMQPDLVLAGRFSSSATVGMLQRLGVPIALFDPAYGLDDVRDRMIQMGDVLGQSDQAADMVAAFDERLATLRSTDTQRPRAALYYANGYTSGDRTLAGQILTAAGFDNIASAAGLPNGGIMPLEVLAMTAPDVVITARPHPGASRSEAILAHPVVTMLRQNSAKGSVTNRDWVCGTPFVLEAIGNMADLRRTITAGQP